jgi:hypothetical protein
MHLPLRRSIATCACLILCSATLLAAEKVTLTKKPNLVWDGDTVAIGTGWAKAGGDKAISFAADAPEAAGGKVALKLQIAGANWVRAGFRWTENASKAGFNAKPFTHLHLQMKAVPQAAPADIAIHLVGIGQNGDRIEGPGVSLNQYAPKVLGGGKNWHQVLIPITALTAAKDFDPTNINEVMLVATGGPAMLADLYIDNIGFAKAGK